MLTPHGSSADDYKNDWSTPQWFYDLLNEEFHFTVDVCASPWNAKHERYFDEQANGLKQSWKDEVTFCNPPWDQTYEWMQKNYIEALANNALCVMLTKAATETKWFQQIAYPYGAIRFLDFRLKYELPPDAPPRYSEKTGKLLKNAPAHASIVTVFYPGLQTPCKLFPTPHTLWSPRALASSRSA